MLSKGHHGVELDAEAWDRLTTWVDLNAPCHGTWQEVVGLKKMQSDHERRCELRSLYGGPEEDPEAYPAVRNETVIPVKPAVLDSVPSRVPRLAGWPFDATRAGQRQASLGRASRTIPLGDGAGIELVRVPSGQFVMGSADGCADERPLTKVSIEKSFWIGRFEITNEQYSQFDVSHDSRYEHKGSWSFSERHLGWPLNRPKQPVVRVSWADAMDFCKWLSEKTGARVSLPTEAQWEWACRAGTSSPTFYGDLDADFSKYANMADVTIRELAYDTDGRYTMDLVPRDVRFDDGQLVTTDVGSYMPNRWGLHDMHGNVWEWTRTAYQPYPYHEDDGRNAADGAGPRVARGGSWYDLPKRCRSASRLSYPAWQKVYNVGFRVVVEFPDSKDRYVRDE